MSVITCAQCNKKISSKFKECPHCDASMDVDDDGQQSVASSNINQQLRQISNQNMIAIVLFMVGMYVMYYQTPGEDSLQLILSQVAVGIAFIWYIVNRIRHFIIKGAAKNR
jgi:cation transport ATPase